jgi:hypothetical protein
MARKAAEKKELILRGANGVLYRIPHSVLKQFVIPPEEIESALKALRVTNPALAAQEAVPGGPLGAVSHPEAQVIINVFTSPTGPSVSYGREGAPRLEEVYVAQQSRPAVKAQALEEVYVAQQSRPAVKAQALEEVYVAQQSRPAVRAPELDEAQIAQQSRPAVRAPETARRKAKKR